MVSITVGEADTSHSRSSPSHQREQAYRCGSPCAGDTGGVGVGAYNVCVCVCVCVCVYVCVCVCVCVYVCILPVHRERERERERDTHTHITSLAGGDAPAPCNFPGLGFRV